MIVELSATQFLGLAALALAGGVEIGISIGSVFTLATG